MGMKLFRPADYESFVFLSHGIELQSGVITLKYRLAPRLAPAGGPTFTETIVLPGAPFSLPPDRIAALLKVVSLLHLAAGVSYYKTATPPLVQVLPSAPGPATTLWLNSLYRDGLGEFYWSNNLPQDRAPLFTADPAHTPARPSASAQSRAHNPAHAGLALVPVGGGKDSCVTIEALRQTGHRLTLFSVNRAAPVTATVRVAALPHLVAQRRLSPNLLEVNASGAFNGHVPVTAIVSLIAVATAIVSGHDAVIMSNESSASFGSTMETGQVINHQYSKGYEAETLLASALEEEIGPYPAWFSLLRPWSEFAIARRFASLTQYHEHFVSCNRAFTQDRSGIGPLPTARTATVRTHVLAGTASTLPERGETSDDGTPDVSPPTRWCNNCAKCRFVFLILAPFLPPSRMKKIFGKNLLEDDTQLDGYRLLVGTHGSKPFECVGMESESTEAFQILHYTPEWQDATIVREMAVELGLRATPENSPARSQLLRPSDQHRVPPAYQDACDAIA